MLTYTICNHYYDMGSVVMVVRTSGSLVVHVMMGCKLNSLVHVKNVLSPSQATDDPAEEAGGHAEAEAQQLQLLKRQMAQLQHVMMWMH